MVVWSYLFCLLVCLEQVASLAYVVFCCSSLWDGSYSPNEFVVGIWSFWAEDLRPGELS